MTEEFTSEYQDSVASDSSFKFLFSLTDSSNKYQYDSKAFLFSLANKPGWAPVKLPQTGRHSSNRAYSVRFGSGYMGPHSVEDMTFTFPARRRPIAIHTATLAILAAHRAGTATAAPSPGHSWQELTTSLQTKWKPFTSQTKRNN